MPNEQARQLAQCQNPGITRVVDIVLAVVVQAGSLRPIGNRPLVWGRLFSRQPPF
jgi:hypothetical protein